MGYNSDTFQDLDRNIFNFSRYYLYDHKKIVLCKGLIDLDRNIFNFSRYYLYDHKKIVLCKGLIFAIPPKTIGLN